MEADHWKNKAEELRFLAPYGASPAEAAVVDARSFRRQVQEHRARIQRRQLASNRHLSETSFDGLAHHESSAGRVHYSYQRYDLRRVDLDWLAQLYPSSTAAGKVDGLFFGSCMGAIAALLAVLSKCEAKVELSDVAYYETHLLLSRFFPQLQVTLVSEGFSGEAGVAWLDTSSPRWPELPDTSTGLRAIVVDTSCVEPDSPHVAGWLSGASALGCLLVLVRSHIKLDSFGLELARLGSVVAVAPEGCATDLQAFVLGLRNARSGFGTGFHLPSVYPWLGDPRFVELTRRRTDGIRRITRALADELAGLRRSRDCYEITPTEHELFFYLRTHLDGPDLPPEPGRTPSVPSGVLSRKIAAACGEETPALSAGSFGLDLVTLNDFTGLYDGLHQLRVSGADVPIAWVPRIARAIRDALADWSEGDSRGG